MRYRRITYGEHLNTNRGDMDLLTPCPFGRGVQVASNDCWRCKYFVSLYQCGDIECSNPLQFENEPKQLTLFPDYEQTKIKRVAARKRRK